MMKHACLVAPMLGLAVALAAASPSQAGVSVTDPIPTIVAGDPNYTSDPDLPANRVDANVLASAFAGVGSLEILYGTTTYICSGTLISPWHVLTAGHAADFTGDGVADVTPGNITFHLNANGNYSSKITASKITINPNFTGFANLSVNDDLAIITLSEAVPAGVPIYNLYTRTVTAGTTFILVGYGRSGDGRGGFYVAPTFDVKRTGQNAADLFAINDEDELDPNNINLFTDEDNPTGTVNEAFVFDFDAPDGYKNNQNKTVPNLWGGTSLGNTLETTVGGGDSGGPSFVYVGGEYLIAGINTFSFTEIATKNKQFDAPLFGSGGGGMLVPAYATWINSVMPEPATLTLVALGGLFILRRRRA
jgi:hypothetical protein